MDSGLTGLGTPVLEEVKTRRLAKSAPQLVQRKTQAGLVVNSWFAKGSVSEGGECYFAPSLGTPEEVSGLDSEG